MRYPIALSMVVMCFLLGCISTSNENPTTTTTTSTTLAQVNCTALAEKIISDLKGLNHCSEDSECGVTSYPCPFGCMIYNQYNNSSVESRITEYGSTCGYCSNTCSYSGGGLLCDTGACVPLQSKMDLGPSTHDYHPNETIVLTLQNTLNRTVYLEKCADITLELRAEGRWTVIPANSCTDEFIKINPTSNYTIGVSDFNMTLARYRFIANVWVKCYQFPKSSSDCRGNVTLISDEFRIR